MFKIENISFNNSGKKINYKYSYSRNISRYFNQRNNFFVTYDKDVSEIPNSIAVIPLLGNLIPISWFAGFNVCIDEIDEDFYNSLLSIKRLYNEYYPNLKNIRSEIIVNKIVKNKIEGGKTAALFSGGADAYATLFRHYKEISDLVTIHGPDVGLDNNDQWRKIVESNEKQKFLKDYQNIYIKSNLRDFYTFKVNSLLEGGLWWAKIQYGLGLTSLTAPVSYINGNNKLYIASTRSVYMKFLPWGSMPETDNEIGWSGLKVVHDAFELTRQDKLELIVNMYDKFDLKGDVVRVCYSDVSASMNCSKCEKCIRTCFGIMLLNSNPNHFGFNVDSAIYDKIANITSNDFGTSGVLNYWKELLNLAKNTEKIYVFSDQQKETERLHDIIKSFEKNPRRVRRITRNQKIKMKIINSNPKLFRLYLKLRQKL